MSAAPPVTPSTFSSGSLYVGDLSPDVNETLLFEIFKKVGPVASIRVCRDAVTRRSLGYAYVNFHNYSDAERALDLLNYKEIATRPCRIMWSQRDPALRKSGSGNIFIKNLDKSIDNKALYDTFATFGNILSCKVAMDENGVSRGFGFVHYEQRESAEQAIAKVNGMLLCGKPCFVGEFISRKDRLATQEPKWTNVFVKNLSKDVTDEGFKTLFAPFGTITSAVLSKDEKGQSKGFGFVNFETHEQAERAIEEMNHKVIQGNELFVGRAQKKAEREKELRSMFDKLKRERMSKYQGVNLYVKNLDDSIDDERLRQEFSHCGTITSAKVMTDEKGQSKGFGFVCFATPDEATKAVTEMNSKMILNKPIYVALAQRKEQRKAQLEAQYAQRNAAMRTLQPPVFHQPHLFFGPPGRGFMVHHPGMVRGGRYAPGPGRGYGPGPMLPAYGMPPTRGRGGMRGGKIGRGQDHQNGPGYGFKYNANVRNPAQPIVPPEQPQQPLSQPQQPHAIPAADKQMLGEQIYISLTPLLKTTGNEGLAGKITGMFLESMALPDLMELVSSQDALIRSVNEALKILEVHGIIKKPE